MSVWRQIGKILTGLLIITGAILMIMLPEFGYIAIALTLSIMLLISGIGQLVYFFSMARHMVGGRETLYKGLITLDFALFTMSVADVPRIFVMIYLIAVFGVTGLFHLLRGLEARKKNDPRWYRRFVSGVLYLGITTLCLLFIRNRDVMVVIYSIGLILMGWGRILGAFRKSKIIYIQ